MNRIDPIVFGDNQFFGINHMSQEKAQEQAERFADIDAIFGVYDQAFDAGIRAVMLNSNERAVAICDRFRSRKSEYPAIAWYPSIPYPHKYASLVAEKGMVGALNAMLFAAGTGSALGKIARGGMALATLDAVRLMKLLVDQEMGMFRGLDIRVVFLQNIVTDLMLGYDQAEILGEYCAYVRKAYGALPGLITQNMPLLRRKLIEWGLRDVVICSSINKIGYLMSPDVDAYVDALAQNDGDAYPMMAMSTLASGAIPAPEAYEFVNRLGIQSVVFGASSRKNIDQTVTLIGK
ncbi:MULTISPECIES: hypothetical protein [unclassified Sphingomonas]|uniref:hypothetical protein n=1 Tax=unclassified Sphingomonas TaxID=196159 RepID=UPI0006F2DED8|nr:MULTISPECIES: hypothetical protein [unclassified Sphingomonas]KQX18544.1 hypothetical protein ASD17_15445 [Sphingomonas sp. Root1294]KQY72132.1 hypothetical protein ASD39_19530 [Sphingomonas sp. Root50]KRB94595.1 hypothetical protein ASE22_01220 [Sphingomonas sp. Root720]